MLFLELQGLSGDEVYNLRPEAFKQVYRAAKRLEVERTVQYLYATNQAMNGTEKSIGDFISALDVWSEKPVESKSRLDKYRASLSGKQTGRK